MNDDGVLAGQRGCVLTILAWLIGMGVVWLARL